MAAALGFLAQPMVAKMVLPLFGGSPATWTVSMVFYQAVLLAAYSFAHLSTRLVGPARQPLLQLALLGASMAALPVGRHLAPPSADESQTLALFGVLALTVAAPFFLVSCTGPLLQRWLSATPHPAARDPYFLYAASNAGSLLGLVSYPLIVEPRLSLDAQADLWTGTYVLYTALVAVCAGLVLRHAAAGRGVPVARSAPLTWTARGRWILFAFIPSSLMLGVTTVMSTDIAAAPLLWVLPLSVYLLSFVVAFSRWRTLSLAAARRLLPLFLAPAVLGLVGTISLPIAGMIGVQLGLLFAVGLLGHGRLAKERPPTERMTEYYLLVALGGVLGGVFNALVAPAVFDTVIEYYVAVFLAMFLYVSSGGGAGVRWRRRNEVAAVALSLALVVVLATALAAQGAVLWAAGIAVVAGTTVLAFGRQPQRGLLTAAGAGILTMVAIANSSAVYSERTFFGVLRVTEAGSRHLLTHGTTLHGEQDLSRRLRSEPLSYYARSGPIGDVFRLYRPTSPFRQVDVVGLGVGSLAAYGRPREAFTFYEIDPGVARIATDFRLFTYLADSRATIEIVLGDGRLSLEGAPSRASDLLVVDAFSSDAIPVHLLTREAVEIYRRRLRPDGLLAIHVTNRHLELASVVAVIAAEAGLAAVERVDIGARAQPPDRPGRAASHWIVLASSPYRLAPLVNTGWTRLRASPGVRAWTDDFSNVVGALRWP